MTSDEILNRLNSGGESRWTARGSEFVCSLCDGLELALKEKSALINLNSTNWEKVRKDKRTSALLDWICKRFNDVDVDAKIPDSTPMPNANAVCLSIRLLYKWGDSSERIIEIAKEILERARELFSSENETSRTNGKEFANTPSPVARDSGSARKTSSKKSGKQVKAGDLDWSNVSFCDPTVINPEDIVNILVDGKESNQKIFPKSLRKIFLQRYGKMKENFLKPLSEGIWRQGGGKWGSNLSLADPTRYKDALLRIDKECFSQKDDFWVGEDGLLEYPCVGHDLPVWLSSRTRAANVKSRKIMIVSQDPLRNGHGAGALYLSTPWGLHSKEYRSNKAFYKLLHRLISEEGATVFLTDWCKIYNKHKRDKGGAGRCYRKGDSICQYATEKGCGCRDWGRIKAKKDSVKDSLVARYRAAYEAEKNIFGPNCIIITLGQHTIEGIKFNPLCFEPQGAARNVWTLYHPEAHWKAASNPLLKKGYKNLEDYYMNAFSAILKSEVDVSD